MEEIVLNYINRNFDVIYKRNNFDLIFINSNKTIPFITLEIELKDIFGDYLHWGEFTSNWRVEKIKSFTKKFHEFLSKCHLILGVREWLVIHEIHGQVDFNDIITYTNDENKDCKVTLKKHFDEWFSNEVIAASEKAWKETF